jgi:hypothetical protein
LLAEGKFDAIGRLIEQAAKILAGPPEVAT